jgi:hypothetical protein
MLHSGYRPSLPHEHSTFELDCLMDVAIVMGQPDPYRTREESPVGNPYGPSMGYLERTTTNDNAHMERQVSTDGRDDVDNGDDSHDIPQPDSEDIAQPKAPALLVLKDHEVWTIGMFICV